MRVLVTGSAGRLGRSTALGLAAAGHDVIGADRVTAGLDRVDERIADLFVAGELTDGGAVTVDATASGFVVRAAATALAA